MTMAHRCNHPSKTKKIAGGLTALAIVLFVAVGLIASGIKGCIAEVFSQEKPKQYVPVPDPIPDYDPSGLDPIEQRRMKDRIRVHELEQKIASLEREAANMRRLVLVQVRQIQQLQRYTFGLNPRGIGDGPSIGSDGQGFGAKPQQDHIPIETPADLIPDKNGGDDEE